METFKARGLASAFGQQILIFAFSVTMMEKVYSLQPLSFSFSFFFRAKETYTTPTQKQKAQKSYYICCCLGMFIFNLRKTRSMAKRRNRLSETIAWLKIRAPNFSRIWDFSDIICTLIIWFIPLVTSSRLFQAIANSLQRLAFHKT